jgi:hypothetical protein
MLRTTARLLRPAANQSGTPGLWQDPVYGYYEMHGKMEFQPGEEYGISDAEKQRVLHRYRVKEILKKEYLRREYDPYHYKYKEGVIVSRQCPNPHLPAGSDRPGYVPMVCRRPDANTKLP